MTQSIANNTAVALGGRFLHVVLGIAITAAITRLLGPSAFGAYATLLAVCSLVVTLADSGLYLSLTRAIGENPQRTPELLSHITWLRLILLAIAFMGGSLTIVFLPALRGLALAFWIAALGFAAQSFSQLLMGIFQARSVVWRATVGDLVGRLLQLTVILGLPLAVPNSSLTVGSAAAAATLGSLLTYGLHRFLLPFRWRLEPAPAWSQVKSILKDALPLGALLVLNMIYFRIDTVLLSLFRPTAEVGLYGLAYRIIESALFVPAMFGGLLLPHLSNPRTDHRQLLHEAFRAVAWAGLACAALLAIFARPLILFISGPEFVSAAPLLQILSLALAFMFAGNVFGFTLVALHRQQALFKLYLVLTVGNILLNLLLIPRWGVFAAAWTTVATEVAATLTAGLLTWRQTRFSLNLFSLRSFRLLSKKP